VKKGARSLDSAPPKFDPAVIMKAIVTHALTAFALAMLVGYAVQPAEATPTVAPNGAGRLPSLP
jgi:hypothetical protein